MSYSSRFLPSFRKLSGFQSSGRQQIRQNFSLTKKVAVKAENRDALLRYGAFPLRSHKGWLYLYDCLTPVDLRISMTDKSDRWQHQERLYVKSGRFNNTTASGGFYLIDGMVNDDQPFGKTKKVHNGRTNNQNRVIVRKYTTKPGSDDQNKGKNSCRRNEALENESIKESTTKYTDPEFAEYLNGESDVASGKSQTSIKPPILQPKLTSTSSNAQSTVSKTSTRYEWFNTLLDDQSDLGKPRPEMNETYRHIERNQRTNLEKIRAKRVVTVYRALMGNVIIASFKLLAFLHSGSSALKAEFIHSVVDCGNQSLLLLGLRDSGNKADRAHPYGYGKSIYFWSLVSALGTFFLGAGVSMTQAIPELINGPSLHEVTWHVWSVLGISFVVDGYVLTKTVMDVKETMPRGASLWKNVHRVRDPATLAILLEDGAACLGIVVAIGGIAMTQALDMPVFDALAGVGISGLLAAMGMVLVRVNHRFLLGQAVDQDIIKGIEKILLDRISIDNVHSVQSQWIAPDTFSYKAEVDFDGTFLAAKLLPRYQKEFAEARATLDQDLRVLLSWYAEDVMRTVEREVRHIEAEIRKQYPGAQYIELEPMSKDSDRYAIDDGTEAQLKRIENEALNRYLKSLYQDRRGIFRSKDKNKTTTKEDDENKS